MRKFLVLLFLIPLFATSQVYNKGLILHGDTLFLCSGNGDSVRINNTIDLSFPLRAYQELGWNVKAEPIGVTIRNFSNLGGSPSDGSFYVTAVYLPIGDTITGVTWYQGTSGNYTADNYNGFGLYKNSGGTLTLVASSTDDGNIWKGTTQTWQTKAFSTPYIATPGVYFIAQMFNASAIVTNPTVGGGTVTNQSVSAGLFPNNVKIIGVDPGSTTSLPSTVAFSTLVSTSSNLYYALYK